MMEGATERKSPKKIAEHFLETAKINIQRDGYLASMVMAFKKDDKALNGRGAYFFPFEFNTPEEKEIFFKRTALYLLNLNPDEIILISEGWMIKADEGTVAPLSVPPSEHPNRSEVMQVIATTPEGSHGIIVEFGRDKENKIHFGKPMELPDGEDAFSMDKNTNFGRFTQTWKNREEIAKYGPVDTVTAAMLDAFIKQTGGNFQSKKINLSDCGEDENGS